MGYDYFMTKKAYTSGLTTGISSIQKDFDQKKINKEEFRFLVGFLLQSETNKFINTHVEHFMPKNDVTFQATYMKYQGNMRLNHA